MALGGENVVTPDLTTADNSWTGGGSIFLEAGQTASVRIGAVARGAETADCAMWEVRGLFRRNGSDPVNLVGSVLNLISPVKTLGAALWDFRVYSDNDEYVYVDVKGSNTQDVGWYVFGEVYSLDYPS